MSTRNLTVLLLFLFSTLLKGQGELDVKIDLYPLITGQGLQLSVEKKVSKKWGIDASFYYSRSRVYLQTRDLLTRQFLSEDFKSRRFSSTLSTNIYLFPEKEKDLDFYLGPIARVEWLTYVDPAYYIAARRANFPNRNPFEENPELDVGIIVGFEVEIFDNIILEPSFGSVFELSGFIRSKKEGYPYLGFEGWLSVRIAYRFRKGD